MIRTTLRGLWARKRRMVGTATAVVLGVAFLAATLVLGDTLDASFDDVFTEANAGIDVVVRSDSAIDSDEGILRADLDAGAADGLAEIDGVEVVVGQIDGTAQLLAADGTPLGGDGPPTMGGAWIDDPVLNPYSVTEGRAPSASGEVVIDEQSATDGALAVGDTATVRTPEPAEVTVVGLVGFGERTNMIGATYVGFTPDDAATLLGHDGTVSSVLVRGDGSISDEALRDAVADVVSDGAEAITGAELTAEQRASVEGDFLGFVKVFLLAFAGVALVVATFSIHNTFTILVAQRTRESALLRAIGASRRQVLTAVAVESLVVGAIASVVGLGVGLGLAAGLAELLAGMGLDLGGTPLQITAATLVTAAVVGTATTLVASAVPAVRAARIAPIEALRDAAAETDRTPWVRAVVGGLLAAVGIAIVVTATGTPDGAVARAGLGTLALVVGTVVLGPVIARPAASLLGAPIAAVRGPVGRLARRNAVRNPHRTAGSALALVIGTTVVALFATFGASVQHSIDQTVDRSFGGDLVVTQDAFSSAYLSSGVAPAIGALDEVERTVTLSDATVTVDGAATYPTVADPADLDALVDLDVEAGSMADLAPGEVAISTRYAEDHDLDVGDALEVAYLDGSRQDLVVGARFGVADLMGDLIVTPTDWVAHSARPSPVAILVGLADGVDLATGREAVEAVAADNGGPKVQDRDQYVEEIAGEIDSLLALIYGLLGLAVVIALMGLANTLALSVHERTREIGLLRAVGLGRGGLRATVRWESVITAALGTGVGLALGTFAGWGLVRAMGVQEGFGTFQAPTATLAVLVVLAALAGVVAAVRPARRAARIDVLDAIATA